MNDSYRIHRDLIPHYVVTVARRRLLLELRRCGVTPAEIREWSQHGWWPSIRNEPEFLTIRSYVETKLVSARAGRYQWADTQILIRLPDEDDVEMGTPHIDEIPHWAVDPAMRYRTIFSVELSDVGSHGGGTVLYPQGDVGICPPMRQGDILEMGPQLLHSGSPNHRGEIRMALFFRVLELA